MGFTEHGADKDVKGCYGEPISISNQTFLMCVHSDTAMFSSLIPLKLGNLMEVKLWTLKLTGEVC